MSTFEVYVIAAATIASGALAIIADTFFDRSGS